MSTQPSRSPLERVAGWLLAGLAAPFRRRNYRHLAYLLLLFPLGLGYFIAVAVVFSVGVGLTFLFGVGLLVLAVGVAMVRALAWFEREQLNRLLGLDVAQPSLEPGRGAGAHEEGSESGDVDGDDGADSDDAGDPGSETGDGSGPDEEAAVSARTRLEAFYLDWSVPFELAFLVSKLAWGVVAFALAVSAATTTASFFAVLLYYDAPGVVVGVVPDETVRLAGGLTVPWGDVAVGAHTVIEFTGWTVDTLPEALVFAGLGVLFGVAALNVLVGFSRLAAWWASLLLDAGTPAAVGRRLRELW